MDKKYVDLFFDKGILRISSFKRFQNYPDEIRGDKSEGSGTYETFSTEGVQDMIMTNNGLDKYLLCSSFSYNEKVKKDFDTDSCLKIKDPLSFSNAILNSIPGSTEAFLGFCNYQDFRVIQKNISPYSEKDDMAEDGSLTIGGPNFIKRINETIGNGIDLLFVKENKYEYQLEFRFVWSISHFFEVQDFIDVQCKEAIQFCERID